MGTRKVPVGACSHSKSLRICLRRRWITLVIAVLMALSSSVPALAADHRPPTIVTPTTVPVALDGFGLRDNSELRRMLDEAERRGLDELTLPFGRAGKSKLVIRHEAQPTASGTLNPQFQVGLGWYIYVYLDRGDWEFLAGLGLAGASAALCGWLAPSVVGGIACGTIAYVIAYLVVKWSAPPPGYCRELKFTYAGLYVGTNLVRRSC